MPTHPDRLARALRALDGLSVGDAFGERFFTTPHTVERWIALRALPGGTWRYTDDTVMALSIVDVLIVGGILAADPTVTIPPAWLGAREPLDRMARDRLDARFRRQDRAGPA